MLATPSSRFIFGTLPWYSVTMVTAICVALFLACREEKRLHMPKDTVIDLALWLIPCGIIGARLYYVAFAWDTFAADPISILYIWRGGLAIYGAILGGLLAACLFAHRRKLSLLRLTDMIVPGLALAQAIGRWGNYFNQEAYGLAITDPAWQFFPAAVLISEGGLGVWHMATFFYESLWDAATFAALMGLRRHIRRKGDLLCWYALLYGGGRLLIEGLRLDSLMAIGGTARISQLLSVAMCLAVMLLFALRTLRRPTARQIIAGAVALAASLAAVLALPRPAPAFPGYEASAILELCLSLTASAMLLTHPHVTPLRRTALLLPVAVALFTLLLRAQLGQAGISGFGASTLLCGLFTLTAITSAACLYPRPEAADASESPVA